MVINCASPYTPTMLRTPLTWNLGVRCLLISPPQCLIGESRQDLPSRSTSKVKQGTSGIKKGPESRQHQSYSSTGVWSDLWHESLPLALVIPAPDTLIRSQLYWSPMPPSYIRMQAVLKRYSCIMIFFPVASFQKIITTPHQYWSPWTSRTNRVGIANVHYPKERWSHLLDFWFARTQQSSHRESIPLTTNWWSCLSMQIIQLFH